MTEGANVRLIRDAWAEGIRAAESGQFDGWLGFFSEDIEWEAVEDAPDAGTYRGHDGIRGYLEDWISTVDGFKPEIREMTEVGDSHLVVDARIRGRVKGTDSEMVFDYSQALWIADGKITHIKEFREHDDAVSYAEDSERSTS
jgi:ketosteroid isomerase-like protein